MRVQRSHDKFYLKEDYKNKPKEYFKLVKSEIEKDLAYMGKDNFCMLDVGCETGSFLAYIRKHYPDAELFGMDVMSELLDKLNSGMGENEKPFHAILGSIADESALPEEKFDFITMLGVMSIFEDFRPIILNLKKMLNNNGYIYIFSIFNPENLDVLIKSKKSCDNSDVWETGWNTFSIKSIEKFCEDNGLKYQFIPFELKIDIEKHEDDPLRSWTLEMKDEKKMIVNGLQLVHNFYLLKLWQ